MAKKKTKGVKYWKKKANAEFSRFIRLRDALLTTGTQHSVICCTCAKGYPAFGKGCAQAGHFIPGRKNAILYDEECCHAQCYNCNVNLKGNWPEYMRFMMANYGRETVDRLLALNKTIVQYKPVDLEEIRDEYKQKCKDLIKENS